MIKIFKNLKFFIIIIKLKMDKYELIEHIGKGSFGVVSKIKRKADGKILVWFLLIFYKKLKILNFFLKERIKLW